MKVFVLGHKGFVGSHLLPKLKKIGYDIVTDMRYFNDRHDVFVNLAAVTHTRNEFDPKLIESNIILANEVFKRSGRIIYMSSCSAKHFTNPYAESKLWSEYLGQKHGNALGLRLHNLYGPNNNKGIVWFLMKQKDGANIELRGPNLVRDYIHVDDVINYLVSLIGGWFGDSEVRDVGTGIGTRTIDVVQAYEELSGKQFKITTIDAGENEPYAMVSENPIPSMALRMGLLKTIQSENINTRSFV